MTTHLAHQTRQLHNLTFPLLSPLEPPPDPDAVDELLPVLAQLADQMPRPPAAAHASLATLHGVTSDLVSTLSYLSDTLHMQRQTTITAARRLRAPESWWPRCVRMTGTRMSISVLSNVCDKVIYEVE